MCFSLLLFLESSLLLSTFFFFRNMFYGSGLCKLDGPQRERLKSKTGDENGE